jgi:hypothetical protein
VKILRQSLLREGLHEILPRGVVVECETGAVCHVDNIESGVGNDLTSSRLSSLYCRLHANIQQPSVRDERSELDGWRLVPHAGYEENVDVTIAIDKAEEVFSGEIRSLHHQSFLRCCQVRAMQLLVVTIVEQTMQVRAGRCGVFALSVVTDAHHPCRDLCVAWVLRSKMLGHTSAQWSFP